jgi:hypothetical protein
MAKKGLDNDLKFDWITKKLPKEIKFEEDGEKQTDYKEKLKALFNS